MGYVIFFILFVLAIILVGTLNSKSKKNQHYSTFEPEDRKKVTRNISFEDSNATTGKYLVVDTETTGLPKSRSGSVEDSSNWPYILQIAWLLLDEDFRLVNSENCYLDFKGVIPLEAYRVHKIDKALLKKKGEPTREVFARFLADAARSEYIVCHNISFDIPIIKAELHRNGLDHKLDQIPTICTMTESKYFVDVYNRGGYLKNPKLEELYLKCFYGSPYAGTLVNTHNAYNDVNMTADSLRYLIENDHLQRFKKQKRKSTSDKKAAPELTKPVNIADFNTFDLIDEINRRALEIESYQKERAKQTEGLSDEEKVFDKSNPFFKKKVVITGVFYNFSRNDLRNLMTKLGAIVNENVSSKIDYLISGNEPGPTKIAKMKQYLVDNPDKEIISESKFLSLLNGIVIDQYEHEGKIKSTTILIEDGKLYFDHATGIHNPERLK